MCCNTVSSKIVWVKFKDKNNVQFVHFYSPEGLEQDSASASNGAPLRGRSTAGRKHRFDLAARTLLARAGEIISQKPFPSLHLNFCT